MDMIVLGQVERIPLVTGNIYRYDRKQRMRKRFRSHWCPGRTDSDAATRLLFEKNFTSALLARHFLIQ